MSEGADQAAVEDVVGKAIPLVSAITAHGEEITHLTFRRPTVQEVRSIKSLPYSYDANEQTHLDMDVVAKYIAVCAGIPMGSVNQLDLSDLNAFGWLISGFFMTAASKPKTSAI